MAPGGFIQAFDDAVKTSSFNESGLKLKNYGENRSYFQHQKLKPLSFNTRLRNEFLNCRAI
jgi:hypothetical protein